MEVLKSFHFSYIYPREIGKWAKKADKGKEWQNIKKQQRIWKFISIFVIRIIGANANTNGLIRQYIPTGTDLSGITDEFVAWVENRLNNRPRKSLGYLTPNDKFNFKQYEFHYI